MLASGLPSTFVPGRNLVFFTYAAALGYRRGLTTLVGGMCETDFLRVSRLPRRDAARARTRDQARYRDPLYHRDAADVADQGGDLDAG